MAEQMLWGPDRRGAKHSTTSFQLARVDRKVRSVAPAATLPDPRVAEAASAVRRLLPGAFGGSDTAAVSSAPQAAAIGIVLGSGLGGFVDRLSGLNQIAYSAVPHLHAPTVAGHGGSLCVGNVGGARVLCLKGRVHLYEGHEVRDVVLGCRLLVALGCRAVLLTNAAGGIRDGLTPGSLMLLSDHLNLTGRNPLTGAGYAFVDLTHTYDAAVRAAARRAAAETSVALEEGVYAGLLGPTYETPAEVRMLRTLGADAVGMSTVLEAIAIRHLGARVGAMSCITNLAAGLSGVALAHTDVQETAKRSREAFETLLARWVELTADAVLTEE